jgi:hypothetical protein
VCSQASKEVSVHTSGCLNCCLVVTSQYKAKPLIIGKRTTELLLDLSCQGFAGEEYIFEGYLAQNLSLPELIFVPFISLQHLTRIPIKLLMPLVKSRRRSLYHRQGRTPLLRRPGKGDRDRPSVPGPVSTSPSEDKHILAPVAVSTNDFQNTHLIFHRPPPLEPSCTSNIIATSTNDIPGASWYSQPTLTDISIPEGLCAVSTNDYLTTSLPSQFVAADPTAWPSNVNPAAGDSPSVVYQVNIYDRSGIPSVVTAVFSNCRRSVLSSSVAAALGLSIRPLTPSHSFPTSFGVVKSMNFASQIEIGLPMPNGLESRRINGLNLVLWPLESDLPGVDVIIGLPLIEKLRKTLSISFVPETKSFLHPQLDAANPQWPHALIHQTLQKPRPCLEPLGDTTPISFDLTSTRIAQQFFGLPPQDSNSFDIYHGVQDIYTDIPVFSTNHIGASAISPRAQLSPNSTPTKKPGTHHRYWPVTKWEDESHSSISESMRTTFGCSWFEEVPSTDSSSETTFPIPTHVEAQEAKEWLSDTAFQQLYDYMMQQFCTLYRKPAYSITHTAGNQSTFSNKAPNSASGGSKSRNTSSSRSLAQKRKAAEDTSSLQDTNGIPQTSVKLMDISETRALVFACHFYKMNPTKYKRCSLKVLTRVRDIKQHHERLHRLPPYCAHCLREFEDESSRDLHKRQRFCVQVEPYVPPDGVSLAQKEALSRPVDGRKSPEEQWYSIWDIIFPSLPRPSCVYLDFELTHQTQVFRDFLSSDGPRVLREYFESTQESFWILTPEGRNAAEYQDRVLRADLEAIYREWATRFLTSHNTSLDVGVGQPETPSIHIDPEAQIQTEPRPTPAIYNRSLGNNISIIPLVPMESSFAAHPILQNDSEDTNCNSQNLAMGASHAPNVVATITQPPPALESGRTAGENLEPAGQQEVPLQQPEENEDRFSTSWYEIEESLMKMNE